MILNAKPKARTLDTVIDAVYAFQQTHGQHVQPRKVYVSRAIFTLLLSESDGDTLIATYRNGVHTLKLFKTVPIYQVMDDNHHLEIIA